MESKIDSRYIRKKYSKRHHFLPVFYLKGFCNNNGVFSVYDKLENKLLINQKPNSQFYINHLNNFRHEGEVKFTMEESFFSPLDSKNSRIFHKIREPKFILKDNLTPEEQADFLFFLYHLYFRLPQSDEVYRQILEKEGLSNKYFGLSIIENGQKELPLSDDDERAKKIKSDILNNHENLRVFKTVVPNAQGAIEEITRLFEKWNIFCLTSDSPCLISGDQPFIINNTDLRMDNVFNELIFPISKNRLIILSESCPKFLDQILLTNINLSILDQCGRYICFEDPNYLELLIKYRENLEAGIPGYSQQRETFKFMHYQADFIDHNSYVKDYNKMKRF